MFTWMLENVDESNKAAGVGESKCLCAVTGMVWDIPFVT